MTTIHAGDRTSGCTDCAKNDPTLREEGRPLLVERGDPDLRRVSGRPLRVV
jgi:hypothetical protein